MNTSGIPGRLTVADVLTRTAAVCLLDEACELAATGDMGGSRELELAAYELEAAVMRIRKPAAGRSLVLVVRGGSSARVVERIDPGSLERRLREGKTS